MMGNATHFVGVFDSTKSVALDALANKHLAFITAIAGVELWRQCRGFVTLLSAAIASRADDSGKPIRKSGGHFRVPRRSQGYPR
jgi:hypothetical protein